MADKGMKTVPHLLVRVKVEDYAKWKPIFDQFAAVRKANGSKGGNLFRDADGSNEITVLYEWDNLENAHKFAQSEEWKKAMQKAGVIGQPDFYFLDKVEHVQA
jgi:heme-degrading monooxygenase HmoA